MVRVLCRGLAFLAIMLFAGYSVGSRAATVSFFVPDAKYANVLSGGQCPSLLSNCETFDAPSAAATAQVAAICAQSGSLKTDCTLLGLRATPGLMGPYGQVAYAADYSYVQKSEGFPDLLVYSATDIYFFYACPSGYQFNGFNLCFAVGLVPPKNQCTEDMCCVGNPINPGAGGKTEIQTDYVGSGAFPLQFRRAYNSRGEFSGFRIGQNWRHTYDREIKINTLAVQSIPPGIVASARAFRPDGRVYYFSFNGTVWSGDADIPDRLERIVDATGATTGYRYTTSEDAVELYDASGKLLSITNRPGLQQTLSYDVSGRLDRVTDPFGRTLRFEYDGINRITAMVDPADNRFSYSYDANNNLVAAQYPDGTGRQYLYNEPDLTGGASLPNALTGLMDETGTRYATWTYDAQGRAVASEHAGGAAKVQVTFNADGTSTVTDALGTSRIYGFQLQHGVARNTAVSQPCTSCGASANATTYDSNGFVASRTDFNGNVTRYTRDVRGLELLRTEAAGRPQARTITTSWHPGLRLPTQISEPGRTTSLTYDASGNLLQKTIVAGTRISTWTYIYNSNGQVLTVDGPRTDASDVTTYSYDSFGNVATVTNALGQQTQFTAYDAHGRPLTIVDANGLVTQLSYDPRGRLTRRDVGGAVTAYDYDPAGLLSQVTLPDGSSLSYTYDPAQRLIGIADRLGNRIAYALDAMGNPVKEEVFDSAGQLTRTRSQVFDGLNRLAREIGAQNQITSYAYDDNGNVTAITDPLQHTVSNTYDALNRLIAATDPAGGRTQYAYNALDFLTRVTDPRNVATTYNFDGVDLANTQSPDSGLTTNAYDNAGNVVSRTDAKGQRTSYRYDALNRLVGITYADGSQAVHTYDQGLNGLGRLTRISDGGSTLSLSYGVNGRVIAKQQTVIATKTTLNTSYAYNSAGQMTSMTYPSGRVLQFAYDVQGQVSTISVDGRPVIADARYQAFGGLQSFRSAAVSGQPTYIRQFDLDGRMASYTLGNTSIALGYDAASRIVFLADTANPALAMTYDYDALDRLTHAVMPNTAEAFQYDANGNRLSKTIGTSTELYSYAANSNRLLQIAGSQVRTYTTDANGSVTADGVNLYVYDARGRLFEARSAAGTTRYVVNALGQRVAKIGPVARRFPRKPNRRTPVVIFAYDDAGHLIGEYDANGVPHREYVWLGDAPVAVLKPNASGGTDSFAIHVDHLNTPRLVADATGTTVWKWDQQEPFGNNPADENPSGLGNFDLPIRLPGQYFDKETNLHYNYFRDYDPSLGRYGESDPIGLKGGLNTYSYVGGNPMIYVDPLGLAIRGTWINGTPKLSNGSLSNVSLTWIAPEWSWWGYIYVARLSGTSSGVVQASVKCVDDERCLEWEMHRDYPLSVDGSVLLGPNVYASAIGLLGGPKAAIGANAVLLAGKTGFALYSLYSKYGVLGSMVISALLDYGPDQACRAGFPNLTGVPYWP